MHRRLEEEVRGREEDGGRQKEKEGGTIFAPLVHQDDALGLDLSLGAKVDAMHAVS